MTDAGKRMDAFLHGAVPGWSHAPSAIAAIEAEAVAAERARIAEAVRGLRCPNSEHGPYGSAYRDGWYQAQAADLAIIEKP